MVVVYLSCFFYFCGSSKFVFVVETITPSIKKCQCDAVIIMSLYTIMPKSNGSAKKGGIMPKSKISAKKGGAGSADYAIAVYGDAMHQHSVSETDNTIAMNNLSSAPGQSGAGLSEDITKLSESFFGKKEGETTTDKTDQVIVGGKIGGKQATLAEMQQKINETLEKINENNQSEGGDKNKLEELKDALQQKGGKLTKKHLKHINRKMNGGSGVLENVAVPAILLYINQRVGTKKNKGSKKLRKSARISRKLA